jgi:hypothetical protein
MFNMSIDFTSCIERIMSATHSEPKPGPNVTIEELGEILDQIAATQQLSSINFEERGERKYTERILVHGALPRIFRRLHSSRQSGWLGCS